MKLKLRYASVLLVVLALALALVGTAMAFDSGGTPAAVGPDEITWTGQGATDGVLNKEECPSGDEVPDGIDPNSYLHWIFTTDGGSADDDPAPILHLGGTGSGDYDATKDSGGAFHFFTPYFTPDSNLTAYATFDVLSTGRGAWNLVISHGCAGGEALTVTKTADTSFTRTHKWSIDKSVDTENGYEHDGSPKIWLYIDGTGDETATWTVEVTYGGYDDSDWNISGDITIENTGTLDATISSVDDMLAGTPIVVDCGVTFPYVLPVGETLTCTYSEDVGEAVEGSNEVTVTTEEDSYSANAPIIWGDPTTELYGTVNVKDISDLFGEEDLGTVTAPNGDTFTYDKEFHWADYGADNCGDFAYNNTATIVETEQSASATLKVNVQCYIYETAYAKGSNNCFIPDFSQWGWSNQITPGTYEWDLWAGAAQCDTSKGTLVGTVTVVYDGNGYVTVTYNVSSPYLLQETHVYAGYTEFPIVKGKKTVAPGQYTNGSPFDGSAVYVIAHAVVGVPDPDFGP